MYFGTRSKESRRRDAVQGQQNRDERIRREREERKKQGASDLAAQNNAARLKQEELAQTSETGRAGLRQAGETSRQQAGFTQQDKTAATGRAQALEDYATSRSRGLEDQESARDFTRAQQAGAFGYQQLGKGNITGVEAQGLLNTSGVAPADVSGLDFQPQQQAVKPVFEKGYTDLATGERVPGAWQTYSGSQQGLNPRYPSAEATQPEPTLEQLYAGLGPNDLALQKRLAQESAQDQAEIDAYFNEPVASQSAAQPSVAQQPVVLTQPNGLLRSANLADVVGRGAAGGVKAGVSAAQGLGRGAKAVGQGIAATYSSEAQRKRLERAARYNR